MSKSTSTTTVGGTGFLGFLTLMFIAFKLLGVTVVASWSWLWVLSPILLPLGIGIGFLIVFGIIILLAAIFGKH